MNPILISIGPVSIYWYSIFIMLAFIVCLSVAQVEARRFNIPKDFIFNLAFWTLIFGIIGARLYYVLFNWDVFAANPTEIFKIWNGGLAVHGGMIAGVITMIIYTKKYKVDTLKIIDIVAIPMLLAQAVGRWGNFFNGEAHGSAISLETLQGMHLPDFLVKGMNINGVYYHPTFLYESLWCLLGFIIMLFVRRNKYLKKGQLTCLYLIWYSVGRFFIEGMRTDSLMIGGLKAAQLISIGLFVICLLAFMILSRKGKFEDLYNQENGEVLF